MKRRPATGNITGYFEVFAGTLKMAANNKKVGEMVPSPATFHHSLATLNLFDNSAL